MIRFALRAIDRLALRVVTVAVIYPLDGFIWGLWRLRVAIRKASGLPPLDPPGVTKSCEI